MPDPRWDPLWRDIGFKPPGHVPLSELGQYAATIRRQGEPAGAAEFPRIAAHLEDSCEECAQALNELMDLLFQDESESRDINEQPNEIEPHQALHQSWNVCA